jgi:hypothetical protein
MNDQTAARWLVLGATAIAIAMVIAVTIKAAILLGDV